MYFASSVPMAAASSVTSAGYSLAEFAAIDARLPSIMLEKQSMFSASPLPLTLEYWENEKLVIQSGVQRSDGPIDGCYPVRHLYAVHDYQPGELIEVEFSGYRLKETQDGIMYVFGTEMHYVNVTYAWMDKNYPDWETRFMVGKELGLGPAALTAYVAGKKLPHDLAGSTLLGDIELSL